MVYDDASNKGLSNLLAQRSLAISFDNKAHFFWPRGSFDDLFTSEAISAELWPPSERPNVEASLADAKSRELLVAFILEKSKRVFAILLTFLNSGRELFQAINHFRDAGLDDSSLPITSKNVKSRIFYKPGNSSEYREPWSIFGEKHFCDDWQWRFTAPVFHRGQSFLGLHRKTILPFTKVTTHGAEGSGNFGHVQKVTVHPAHIRSILPANRPVSIKKLHRPEGDDQARLEYLETAWRQEVFAHEELFRCEHPNVIKFIAGITKGDDRYLMCEWANGGNLREFWTKNEKPDLTQTLVKDVIVQLQGIADALSVIHSKGFRHGDLKPENIVRQEILPRDSDLSKLDVGELKLCDMGLTKYHSKATEFRHLSTDTRFAIWRHQPPEALISHQPWTRRFDIWSIGCIILDFIVWILEGSEGIKHFNNNIVNDIGQECQYFERKWRNGQTVFYVHTAVEDKIKTLSSQLACRAGETALGDLLAIVETRLLVVDLASTVPELPIRANSEDLKEEIDNIVERGTRDPAYWLEGATVYYDVSVDTASTGPGESAYQTDSGYASLPKDEKNAQQQQTEEQGFVPNVLSDDANTVYSADSMVGDDRTYAFIMEFANAVIRELFPGSADNDTIELLYEKLPDAIRAFALRIGGKNSTLAHRDIMYFTHKHRRTIAEETHRVLGERVPDGAASPEDETARNQTHDPVSVDSWLAGVDNSQHTDHTSIDELHERFEPPAPELITDSAHNVDEYESEYTDTDDLRALSELRAPLPIVNALDNDNGYDSEPFVPEIEAYTRIVSSNVAYKWLMANLKRDVGLMKFDDSATTRMSELLSSIEGPRKISRYEFSDTKIVTFTMEWNPKEFLSAQFSSEDLIGHTICDAITLTGSSRDAFAASCRDYMKLMWPNTGMSMTLLIDKVSSNPVGSSYSDDLEDGSQVTVMIKDSKLEVRVDGGIHTIAEIAEQLGWLGSALNSSPYGSGVAGCMPDVSQIRQSLKDPDSSESKSQEYWCSLGFSPSKVQDPTSEQEGECWHNLFRNPTIAMTYPIPRRDSTVSGLEIPLVMMSALIQTKEVQMFKNTLFLKGFSAMLTPTRVMGSELLWHLNFNEQGERISYLDITHQCLSNIDIGSVENSRHFVGWCSSVKYLAGSVEANYTIGRSRLEKPGSGCTLEKISVSGGKFISAGATFAIANKDRPVHITRDGYIPRLKWIHKKHVVFWDEADKRGWLVNGTSALLHLVRGSLEINRTDEFNDEFLFKSELMETASKPHTHVSAISELKNRSNMKLKLYPDAAEHYEEETSEADQIKTATKTKQPYVLFQDLVSHILNILEKLVDHQVETSAQNGVSLKRHIRKRLEGWDFKDIASNRDPLYPRVATLHPIDSIGKSWVDLVEGIHAITLLGCGFGDLLDPVVSPNSCSDCVLVPKDCYYLTAAVSDLKDIMEDHGDPKSQPPRLCEGVYWHQNKTIFDECHCDPGKHQDLAQVLTSSKTTARSTNTSRSMPPGGAVIFGHNSILKWFHHDDGEPSVSEEPDPRTPEDGLLKVGYSLRKYKDSGLGSSNSGASNSQSYSRARFPESPSVANDRNSLLEDQGSSTNDSEAPKRRSDDLHRPLPLRENAWKPDERHRQARYNARNRKR